MLPEEEQAEIARRRFICTSCPFNSSNAVVDGYKTDRFDEHCIMCGCTITRKTASLDANCGLDCCNAEPITECTCKDKKLKEYSILNNVHLEPKWLAYKSKTDE